MCNVLNFLKILIVPFKRAAVRFASSVREVREVYVDL